MVKKVGSSSYVEQSTSSSQWTHAHTLPSGGTNRMLIVITYIDDTPSDTPTLDFTYDGKSVSFASSAKFGSTDPNVFTNVVLENDLPENGGDYDLVATLDASATGATAIFLVENAVQAVPPSEGQTILDYDTAQLNLTVFGNTEGGMVVDAFGNEDTGDVVSPASGQTEIFTNRNLPSEGRACASYKIVGQDGDVTMTWNGISTSGGWEVVQTALRIDYLPPNYTPININVFVNGVNRTNNINRKSVKKKDQRNQKTDTLRFDIWEVSGANVPKLNDDIQMFDGTTKVFGGVVTKITTKSESEKFFVQSIEAEDYVHVLDRRLFVERFKNKTVGEIITTLRDKYAQNFTVNNVDCTINVESITFSNVDFSKALEKLARLTNYSWYVDYDKDIHFFDVGQELAPYDIASGNGNYIIGSLNVDKDISQLRNRVKVRGGEAEGNERTETFDGGEARTVQGRAVAFDLISKFSERPAVTVNGTAQTVGVEFLSDEDSFDCFWSFQEKYVRFKSTTAPTDGDSVDITGVPLFPIVVQVSENASIAEYGVYEFYKEDKAIKTRNDAIKRAQAELEAYGTEIYEGSFKTYRSGFRSGQRITVDALGVNETFVIQSVNFQMRTNTLGEWKVNLASLHNINIIAFLQYLLEKTGNEVESSDSENILTFQQFSESITFSESVDSGTVTNPPYYYAPDNPADEDSTVNYGVYNESTWVS